MKIKAILTVIIMLMLNLNATATQLPKEVKDYLQAQKKIPSVRYDGVVVYNNNVMYIPILPAYPENVEKLEIKATYPKNQKMDNFPDMVLFNNNMALLKVIRKGENTLTVRDIPDMPLEVKTGIIPQDIMVPRGLVLPESLAGILGDVRVPLIGSAKNAGFIMGRKNAPLPTGKITIGGNKNYSVPQSLKNKLFFVNNFQTEYLQVYSAEVTEPLYSFKTSGVIKDVKPILNGKYLLAATKDKKNLDVLDIDNEYVSKNIDLNSIPTEIVVDDANNKVYVASTTDESLSVIDLTTLKMTEKIQLAGAPQRLSLSPDGKKLAYLDMKTSNIYVLDLEYDEYENKLITNYPNTTEIILKDNVLYLIARTSPKLRIVEFDLLQDIKTAKTKKDKKRAKEKKEEDSQVNAEAYTTDIYSVNNIELETDTDTDEELLENANMYSTSIKDVAIGIKPVDMFEKNNKIYILCAGNNTVYDFDINQNKLTETKLPTDGFSTSFSPVPNSDLAIITNMADLNYVVYDMAKDKALQTHPISEYINTITVLERKNGQ